MGSLGFLRSRRSLSLGVAMDAALEDPMLKLDAGIGRGRWDAGFSGRWASEDDWTAAATFGVRY